MKRIGQRLWISILFAATSLVAPPVVFSADTPASSGSAVVTAAASPVSGDGFQAVAAADEFGSLESAATPDKHDHSEFRGEAKAFKWVLGILFATLVAGLLVRFSATRNLRAVFLTCSVAVLGFYKGACPCPVQSLQYSILNLLGHDYKWQTLVYLLGLLPRTYLFGRVFCGWICHMGALQEFLFLGNRLRYLQSERAQTMMRVNERLFGVTYSEKFGGATINAAVGTVGEYARMTDFCGTKRLTNLVDKEKYETVSEDFGDTNMAGVVATWDLRKQEPRGTPAAANEFSLSADLAPKRSGFSVAKVGLLAYHELDVPLLFTGVRHNFAGKRKLYLQLQAVRQLNAEKMKEVDFEIGADFFRRLRVVAIGSYVYSTVTKERENLVAKMEIRLGF